jgi:anti-sigma factor RsiW
MKEIACVSGVELLMDYLEGVLPADLRAALDEHVAGCPRCAFVASTATRRASCASDRGDVARRSEASLRPFSERNNRWILVSPGY